MAGGPPNSNGIATERSYTREVNLSGLIALALGASVVYGASALADRGGPGGGDPRPRLVWAVAGGVLLAAVLVAAVVSPASIGGVVLGGLLALNLTFWRRPWGDRAPGVGLAGRTDPGGSAHPEDTAEPPGQPEGRERS